MIEPVTYRGATLHVAHLPSCWKIFIFMPGSHAALAETPCAEDIEDLQASIVEARAIVDAALAQRDKLAIDVAHLNPPAEEKPAWSCKRSGARDDGRTGRSCSASRHHIRATIKHRVQAAVVKVEFKSTFYGVRFECLDQAMTPRKYFRISAGAAPHFVVAGVREAIKGIGA